MLIVKSRGRVTATVDMADTKTSKITINSRIVRILTSGKTISLDKIHKLRRPTSSNMSRRLLKYLRELSQVLARGKVPRSSRNWKDLIVTTFRHQCKLF